MSVTGYSSSVLHYYY